MASYDKAKLLRLLEQRQAANLRVRDLSERRRDARSEARRLEDDLRLTASAWARSSGFLDRLLELPIAEAAHLGKEDVEEYERTINGPVVRYASGISLAAYQTYLAARERFRRLDAEAAAAGADFQARFAIVRHLVEAVRAWGFADPELEI